MSELPLAPALPGAVPWPSEYAARYRAHGLWQGQSIGSWFQERARNHATRCALVDGSRRVSYGELAERVAQLATGFDALGVRTRDRVVLQLPNGLELVETLLALLHLAAIPVLALPAHRALELRAFCQRATAKFLVCPAHHAGQDLCPMARQLLRDCPTLNHVLVHGAREPLEAPLVALERVADACHAAFRVPCEVSAAEVALLQLSGGSTGVPKLIARTHDDYLYSVRASAERCQLDCDTRFLAVLPMMHNFTLSSPGILGTLDRGGVIVSGPEVSAERVFALLLAERITLMPAVPALLRSWVEAAPRLLRGERLPQLTLQVGGAKLDEALARAAVDVFGCRLQQVFGMAEGLVNYTVASACDPAVFSTQGRPLSPFDELRIVDPEQPEGDELPRGEVGELQTRGPYTIRGYFDEPSGQARHFTRDGFYRTGDLVRQTEAGDLIVEGRLGDRILRAGEKIAPVEVEDQLREHPLVRDVALVGSPDAYLGERSHAFISLVEGGRSLTTAEVRAFLRMRGLADFKLPDVIHVISELPRTKVGKTDKAALRAELLARHRSS